MAQGRFMVAVRVEPSFFTSAAAAKGQKVSNSSPKINEKILLKKLLKYLILSDPI